MLGADRRGENKGCFTTEDGQCRIDADKEESSMAFRESERPLEDHDENNKALQEAPNMFT